MGSALNAIVRKPLLKRRIEEFILTIGFLTRVPLPKALFTTAGSGPSLTDACWGFPLVGLLVGAVAGGVIVASTALGLGVFLAVLLSLLATVMITGALHEDGLADFSDGLGTPDRDRALEVMRDSRSGSFGILGLFFSLSLRAAALFTLLTMQDWQVSEIIIIMASVHMLARTAMAGMLLLPLARADGMAATAAKEGGSYYRPFFAVLIGLALSLSLLGPLPGLVLFIAAIIGAGLIGGWACHRLGGVTGDVYGAGEQVAEIFLLLTIVSGILL